MFSEVLTRLHIGLLKQWIDAGSGWTLASRRYSPDLEAVRRRWSLESIVSLAAWRSELASCIWSMCNIFAPSEDVEAKAQPVIVQRTGGQTWSRYFRKLGYGPMLLQYHDVFIMAQLSLIRHCEGTHSEGHPFGHSKEWPWDSYSLPLLVGYRK